LFSCHFQNIFFNYHLSELVVSARDACFKDDFFSTLSSMKNKKSSGIDGLPFEFYKDMWDTEGDDFSNIFHEVFSIVCL
jgi:hypothetical protein